MDRLLQWLRISGDHSGESDHSDGGGDDGTAAEAETGTGAPSLGRTALSLIELLCKLLLTYAFLKTFVVRMFLQRDESATTSSSSTTHRSLFGTPRRRRRRRNDLNTVNTFHMSRNPYTLATTRSDYNEGRDIQAAYGQLRELGSRYVTHSGLPTVPGFMVEEEREIEDTLRSVSGTAMPLSPRRSTARGASRGVW